MEIITARYLFDNIADLHYIAVFMSLNRINCSNTTYSLTNKTFSLFFLKSKKVQYKTLSQTVYDWCLFKERVKSGFTYKENGKKQ